MSETTPAVASTVRPTLIESVRASVAWRWLLLAAGVIAGYHYSLYTLWQQLGGQSPMAYLVLVPLLAAALAWLRPLGLVRAPGHDAEFNLLLGLGLILPALIILAVLPVQMGAAYWAFRIDMLSLPLFLAGAVALLFGFDALRAARVPIVFTVLAWPYPYYLLLAQPIQGLTAVTSAATALVTTRLGVAEMTSQSGVFSVLTPSGPSALSVGQACAGLTGIIGTLLVGGAVALLMRGTVLGRLTWLAWGVGLSFAANAARIVLLMVVANRIGMDVALNLLHPVLGMAVDAVVLMTMLLLLPVFELRLPPPDARRRHALPVPRLSLVPLAALALLTGLVALADDDLAGLSPLSDTNGQPRLTAFTSDARMPGGWQVGHVNHFDWGPQYFGEGSNFDRYLLLGPGNQAVWADVVVTPTDALAQYPVESCLAFHGDTITDIQKVSMGSSRSATALDYRDGSSGERWSVVYWVWPVSANGRTYQERIWLTAADGDVHTAPDAGAASAGGFDGARTGAIDALFRLSPAHGQLSPSTQSLVGFSRQLTGGLVR